MRSILAVLAMAVVTGAMPVQAAPCAGFNDVDSASPFCASVEWVKNRGITVGVTATQYDPSSPVTRLQMAAFLGRMAPMLAPPLYDASGVLFGYYVANAQTDGTMRSYAAVARAGSTYYLYVAPVSVGPVSANREMVYQVSPNDVFFELANCNESGRKWASNPTNPTISSTNWATLLSVGNGYFLMKPLNPATVVLTITYSSARGGVDGTCINLGVPATLMFPVYELANLGAITVNNPMRIR